LFIYGIEDPEEANEKLEEIYESVVENIHPQAIAFRSTHAITIISQVCSFPSIHPRICFVVFSVPHPGALLLCPYSGPFLS
jgi:hypothetical protein